MFFDRLTPGVYGYINYKKRKLTLFCAILAVVIAGLIVASFLIFGTIKTLLLVPALLCAIPFAFFFANLAALLGVRSASPEDYSMVRNFDDAGMLLCDLMVVDGAGKRYYFEFAVVHAAGIAAYSSRRIGERFRPESHVTDLLKKRGVTCTFKIYEDLPAFLKAIDSAKPCADEQRAALIRETVLMTCM